MQTKSRQINFRVTEKEYADLSKKCTKSGMKMSNFLLYSGLNKEIIIVDGLTDCVGELRRIGVNLNQITKLCNEGRITCPDITATKEELTKIWQSLSLLTRKAV